MSTTIKTFLDPATLDVDDVPEYGDMPDVSMAYPWLNSDEANGAVWPWRLFFGAEDDPNRKKVAEWMQVDDLAGLTNLWAGVYNGTIYLHAGDSPPESADASDDWTGTPVSGGGSVIPERWHNGEPVLPFTPVPMDLRDSILKTTDGKWRRLVWEPAAIFDYAPTKEIIDESGERNIKRYTLWLIVENPYVAFYTTEANFSSRFFKNGEPARWPFSYYGKLLNEGKAETYTSNTSVDGGIVYDAWYKENDYMANGYRLAPLPWMINNETLESADEYKAFDGVLPGQFYNLAAAWPCPRYLATVFDIRIDEALLAAYTKDWTGNDFTPISREQAKDAIVETVRKAATKHYSIDPALMEELGRSFPQGVQEGSYWQNDPPQFHVVFSIHLSETQNRFPHWFAFMACHAPTALLTASATGWYNDFTDDGSWGGAPLDPGGTPENDEEEEEKDDKQFQRGFYYEAGNGVQIKREYEPGSKDGKIIPGWKHTVHVDSVAATGFATYFIGLTVSTENDKQTYPYGGVERNMYYGVEVDSSKIAVRWKSSWLGQDNLQKSTTISAGTTSDFTASVVFDDLLVTSETGPSFGGDVLIASKQRTFTKKGTYKIWDKTKQRWVTSRFSRVFDVYRLSVRGGVKNYVAEYAEANAPLRNGNCSPSEIQGESEGLDGPLVKADKVVGTKQSQLQPQFNLGDFRGSLTAEYESCQIPYEVTGGDVWMVDGKTEKDKGSISGTFEVSLPKTNRTFNI